MIMCYCCLQNNKRSWCFRIVRPEIALVAQHRWVKETWLRMDLIDIQPCINREKKTGEKLGDGNTQRNAAALRRIYCSITYANCIAKGYINGGITLQYNMLLGRVCI